MIPAIAQLPEWPVLLAHRPKPARRFTAGLRHPKWKTCRSAPGSVKLAPERPQRVDGGSDCNAPIQVVQRIRRLSQNLPLVPNGPGRARPISTNHPIMESFNAAAGSAGWLAALPRGAVARILPWNRKRSLEVIGSGPRPERILEHLATDQHDVRPTVADARPLGRSSCGSKRLSQGRLKPHTLNHQRELRIAINGNAALGAEAVRRCLGIVFPSHLSTSSFWLSLAPTRGSNASAYAMAMPQSPQVKA